MPSRRATAALAALSVLAVGARAVNVGWAPIVVPIVTCCTGGVGALALDCTSECVFDLEMTAADPYASMLVENGYYAAQNGGGGGYGGNYPACISPANCALDGGRLLMTYSSTPDAACALADGGAVHADYSTCDVQMGTNGDFSQQYGTVEYSAQFAADPAWCAMVQYGTGFQQGPPAGMWNDSPGNLMTAFSLWFPPSGPEIDFPEIELTFHTSTTYGINYLTGAGGSATGFFKQSVSWPNSPQTARRIFTEISSSTDTWFYQDGILLYEAHEGTHPNALWSHFYLEMWTSLPALPTSMAVDYFRATSRTAP